MAAFGIGEAEALTGVKAHVLRYWEENIALLSPPKDMGGRRLYSSRDIQLILRLKYLIYERKFTLEGAASQLFDEAAFQGTDAAARNLSLLKADLISIYSLVLSRRAKMEKLKNDGQNSAGT